MNKEKMVQIWLTNWLLDKGHIMVCPNIYLFGTKECDIISVTQSKYIWEIEIKTSLADFKADKKKKSKHSFYKESLIRKYTIGVPYKFYYAIYEFNTNDIPEYAGLIEIKNKKPKIVKQAPVLSNRKIYDKEILQIARSLSFKLNNCKKK